MHVCDCCGLGLRELGLQREGAGGPWIGGQDGHDGGDCVRGVDVEVEPRGGVQAEFRCCWGLRTLASVSRAACCCDVWAAAREPDAGVVLRRRGCQLCGGGDQRAVVGMHVCDGCGLGLRELGLQREGAGGPWIG